MIILGTNSIKDTGFDVANSVRLNPPSNDYFNRTPSSASNRKTFTLSVWIKRWEFSSSDWVIRAAGGGNATGFYFATGSNNNKINFYSEGSSDINLVTAQVFRDPSAWYHIVFAVDTTQSTEENRVKMYVNGSLATISGTYPSVNDDTAINEDVAHFIATDGASSSNRLGCYLSEFCLIDGSALAPTSFGEFDEDSGIWKPIDVSGLTFGTNGFYLDFEDSGALGNDAAGSNNFTANNLTAIDQSTDTCTNNFATWNALFRKGTLTPAFSNGNLTSTFDNGGANEFALTSFGADTGKWYAEVKWISAHGNGATATGILDMAYTGTADPNNAVTNAFGYFGSGTKNVSGTASSYGDSYADGDIIGIAIDMDNNKLYFSKNGTFQNSGDPTTGSTGTGAIGIVAGVTYGIFATDYNNQVAELNTGSPAFAISSGNTDGNGYGNFEYAVPSGYYSLNTKNLAEYG